MILVATTPYPVLRRGEESRCSRPFPLPSSAEAGSRLDWPISGGRTEGRPYIRILKTWWIQAASYSELGPSL